MFEIMVRLENKLLTPIRGEPQTRKAWRSVFNLRSEQPCRVRCCHRNGSDPHQQGKPLHYLGRSVTFCQRSFRGQIQRKVGRAQKSKIKPGKQACSFADACQGGTYQMETASLWLPFDPTQTSSCFNPQNNRGTINVDPMSTNPPVY